MKLEYRSFGKAILNLNRNALLTPPPQILDCPSMDKSTVVEQNTSVAFAPDVPEFALFNTLVPHGHPVNSRQFRAPPSYHDWLPWLGRSKWKGSRRPRRVPWECYGLKRTENWYDPRDSSYRARMSVGPVQLPLRPAQYWLGILDAIGS